MKLNELEKLLFAISEKRMTKEDVSHDINHIWRVLSAAKKIGKKEKADLEVLIPAALFHDIIVYPKYDKRSLTETDESAAFAERILLKVKGYPKHKIEKVKTSILQCSFRKGIVPDLLESKILQDADRLEATGAVAIMRTYSSTGQWKRIFYDPVDPFAKNRKTNGSNYALDLFYERLLVVGSKMHTKTAKTMAKRRTAFLKQFLSEFAKELKEIH